MKQPRLCMEPRAPPIIGDPDLDTGEPRELLDRRCLGRARVCRGDQPEDRLTVASMPQDQAIDRIAEYAHAALGHEADESVDAIGAVDLACELVANAWLAMP